MNSRVPISVMICTKDREKDVKETLAYLTQQTLPPNQVVVVDASAEDRLSAYMASTPFPFECRHIRAEPGLTRQRNIGISNCLGEFILILDDDVIFEPNFIAEMLRPFEDDPQRHITVVIGRIVDNKSWLDQASLSMHMKHRLRLLIMDLFLLEKNGSGHFRYSGLPTYPRDILQSGYVECIPTTCAVFRRHVFDEVCFDEVFYYPPLDDIEFSKRLLDAGYKVYFQASARVLHKKSTSGRLPRFNLYRVWVTHYYYLFRKNWPQTFLRKLAFWWAVLGMIVINLSHPDQAKGIFSGIANIWMHRDPVKAMQNLRPTS